MGIWQVTTCVQCPTPSPTEMGILKKPNLKATRNHWISHFHRFSTTIFCLIERFSYSSTLNQIYHLGPPTPTPSKKNLHTLSCSSRTWQVLQAHSPPQAPSISISCSCATCIAKEFEKRSQPRVGGLTTYIGERNLCRG